MKRQLVNLFFCFLILSSCGKLDELGDSDDTTSTQDGIDPDTQHRIFVTKTRYSGALAINSLTGISAADEICQSLATTQGLSLNYEALLSTSTVDARDKIEIKGAVLKVNSSGLAIKIAEDESDFWNAAAKNLLSEVDLDQTGNTQAIGPWTGSQSTGLPSASLAFCNDWTSSNLGDDGQRGSTTSKTLTWLEDGTDNCNATRPLICISE